MNDSEKAFQHYQSILSWIDRRRDPKTAEFYGEDPSEWKHAKEVAFKLYQDLRHLLGPRPTLLSCMGTEKAKGIPPYRFADSPAEFPCVGVLEYRGMEFPVYDDDCGMNMFVVVDGHSVQVDSFGGETDWYYEIDRIIDRVNE